MNDNSETVQLLPLTSDIVFKQVFGQEESKPILRVFLNDVLGLDIQSAEQITLLNPIIDPKYIDDKMCILDYSKTAPVYGLNLLCFDLYEDSRYNRSFILKDEETNETYRQNFKIAFFELRKAVNELSKTKEVETLNLSGLTARDQWALFINSDQKEVYEKLVEESKTFEEAYERLKKASSDETFMAMYRNREKAIRDWNDSINSARKDGEQRVNALYEKLLQENRGSEIPKAIADPTFRAKLFNEYAI